MQHGNRPVSGAFADRSLTEHDLPHLRIIGTQAKCAEAYDPVTGIAARPQRIDNIDIGDETVRASLTRL